MFPTWQVLQDPSSKSPPPVDIWPGSIISAYTASWTGMSFLTWHHIIIIDRSRRRRSVSTVVASRHRDFPKSVNMLLGWSNNCHATPRAAACWVNTVTVSDCGNVSVRSMTGEIWAGTEGSGKWVWYVVGQTWIGRIQIDNPRGLRPKWIIQWMRPWWPRSHDSSLSRWTPIAVDYLYWLRFDAGQLMEIAW